MITIEFDDIIYSLQKFGGASVYWSQMTSLVEKDNRFQVSHKHTPKYLRGLPAFSSADVFHSSHFRNCISKSTKVVSTVHDLNYELGYVKSGVKAFLNIAERKHSYFTADALICISESTKKDLFDVYPELKTRCPVYTIYHGFIELGSSDKNIFDPKVKYGSYVLYVGGRLGYKNFKIALLGFFESKLWEDGVKLVCTGSAFNAEEVEQIKKLNLSNHVLSVGKVDESALGSLYENAHCLLYTSTYEGFGLPLIEAMSKGCPVIACSASCIPEVVGNAGILVKPTEVDVIANALKNLQDKELRAKLSTLGHERVKMFSWKKSADAHMEVYEKLGLKK